MQVCPSLANWYPSSHSQRKVPGWLLQIAWEPQIWGFSLHSSMSDKEKSQLSHANHFHSRSKFEFGALKSGFARSVSFIIRCWEIRGESLTKFLNYQCLKIASVWNTSFLFLLYWPQSFSCLVSNAKDSWLYRVGARDEEHTGHVNLVWESGKLCLPWETSSADWQDCPVPQEGRL